MGGISGWQLLILLLIVVLVFGTKRLRNIGSDLGGAVKGFRKGMDEGEEAASDEPEKLQADPEPQPTASESVKAEPESRPPGSDV